MAEIVRRRSWGGVLPLGRHVSISGSSFIQCASASLAPPHPGGAKCYPGAEVQGRTGSSIAPPWPSTSNDASLRGQPRERRSFLLGGRQLQTREERGLPDGARTRPRNRSNLLR